jgi:biopolymer transport protein ExbD
MRIRQQPVKRGRIEIIPMIDVVFFMLVFSMLSSLALAVINTPQVDVPEAASAESGAPARVFVTLTREKELYINQDPVHLEELGPRLKEQVSRNPKVLVIVNCDRANTWGEFRALMAAAYAADPEQVAIMTKRGGEVVASAREGR